MAKGAQAKAAKAAHQDEVKKGKAAKAEADEAAKWDAGSKGKGKKEDQEQKAAAARAAKAERDRMLAEEEASNAKSKPAASATKPGGGGKKAAPSRPTNPAPTTTTTTTTTGGKADVPTYSASGLDDALDAMELANERTDKAAVGAKAAIGVDTHPERRFKAAFEAYKERELPELRQSHPGLRLQQYHERLFQSFQKSPENPFNQTTATFNATKEDKVSAMAAKRAETEQRLRTD